MSKEKTETEKPECDTSTETTRSQVRIAGVRQKIGESRGNLQGRSEWFEKRTAGKK